MTDRVERFGNWLFRFRSWIPPLLLAVLVGALWREPAEPPGLDPVDLGSGVVTVVIGLLIRAVVVGTAAPGTSGRNTLEQVADHLNTTGVYSIVRHPLYLGNLFTWVGLALATSAWWAPVVTFLGFGVFYGSIIVAEEAFLGRRFGEEYLRWVGQTPRLVPRVTGWIPARLPFSVRIVLRQEYYGWFTVTLFFTVLEVVARFRDSGRPGLSVSWLVTFGLITAACAMLRTLQRRTTRLDVAGR
ncbi:MAG: methyltransferase family protein [Gemmatimonadales bacterium]